VTVARCPVRWQCRSARTPRPSEPSGDLADRVESFSDGVFAFAITVLVLALGVQDLGTPLGAALLQLWPNYLAYAMSFVVIGAIWINHHAMFPHIVRADPWVLILNLLQLLFVAFLPFPTAVLARAFSSGIDEPIATAFYGGWLALLGLFVALTWAYASRRHRLLDDQITPEKARRLHRRYLIGPVFYAAAALIGLVVPWVAVVMFIGLNVYFLWPHSTKAPVPPTEASAV
jgi:uncharacterized membrane protein